MVLNFENHNCIVNIRLTGNVNVNRSLLYYFYIGIWADLIRGLAIARYTTIIIIVIISPCDTYERYSRRMCVFNDTARAPVAAIICVIGRAAYIRMAAGLDHRLL